MPTDIAEALRAELSASQLDALVNRRENSLIRHDISKQAANVDRLVRGRRVLVVGAEDRLVRPPLSCWWTTVRAASMSADHSENYLAEIPGVIFSHRETAELCTKRTGLLRPMASAAYSARHQRRKAL
jgi:hypothetical protein